jgi:hypothetical protein
VLFAKPMQKWVVFGQSCVGTPTANRLRPKN